LLTAGVDVQLTEKYLVISDPLIDLLRRLEIAAEWFRVAVLVQIFLSVCFCRANDFADFRPPRPRSTFPER
jgi:hypothetical protein